MDYEPGANKRETSHLVNSKVLLLQEDRKLASDWVDKFGT